MSPCGGECRVGRTLPRGGPSSPAHAGAGARRRSSAPPASPNCHQQTIDVGRSAAAARCPTERRTGASRSSRTPQVDLACPSLSTASRSAKRAMPISPLNAVCLYGMLSHTNEVAPAAARPSRARARNWRHKGKRAPFSADRSAPLGATTDLGRERNQAQSAATILGRHGCRRVAASVVLVARCRAVARRRQRPRRRPARGADPRRRQHRPIATNKRSTSAAARRPPAAPQSAAQARRAARAPRRSISHAHRSPRPRAPQSERCHKPPQRSCLNRGAVAHHRLARAAAFARKRNIAKKFFTGSPDPQGMKLDKLGTASALRSAAQHKICSRAWPTLAFAAELTPIPIAVSL